MSLKSETSVDSRFFSTKHKYEVTSGFNLGV